MLTSRQSNGKGMTKKKKLGFKLDGSSHLSRKNAFWDQCNLLFYEVCILFVKRPCIKQ